MIKKILILLGETPSSRAAREFGYRLAKSTGATIAGLAGIDLSYIEGASAAPVGGIALKARLEHELKQQADSSRKHLRDILEKECRGQTLDFEWQTFTGDPNESLNLAVETRDLIITGHDTAFHGKVREKYPEMLAALLHSTPRPVIVCADETRADGEILVAYDGSIPSMRAIQLFALLGLGAGRRVAVTSVSESHAIASRRAAGAAAYLRAHDIEAEAIAIESGAHAAEIINAQIADRGGQMLVMGAYGHRGLRDLLFGSATQRMVEKPPCALFIYH